MYDVDCTRFASRLFCFLLLRGLVFINGCQMSPRRRAFISIFLRSLSHIVFSFFLLLCGRESSANYEIEKGEKDLGQRRHRISRMHSSASPPYTNYISMTDTQHRHTHTHSQQASATVPRHVNTSTPYAHTRRSASLHSPLTHARTHTLSRLPFIKFFALLLCCFFPPIMTQGKRDSKVQTLPLSFPVIPPFH